MIRLFYRFLLLLFTGSGRVLSIFGTRLRAFFEGRAGLREKYVAFEKIPAAQGTIWMHCASLGEFEQGRPVLEAIRKEFPGVRILLTFFSPSGYEVRKNYPVADAVLYLPTDTTENARWFLDAVKPDLAIVVKYEFWPHLLIELGRRGIVTIALSALFRPGQIYFRWYGTFFREALRSIRHFFVQDQLSVRLLHEICIDRCTISGDTRFDRVAAVSNHAPRREEIDSFLAEKPCWVIGSAWMEDLRVLEPLIKSLATTWKFIVVPHMVDDETVRSVIQTVGVPSVKWSQLNTGKSDFSDVPVLVVDTIGLLSGLYRHARYAWVGGAYGKGLHNILEPAVFGVPVFFGNRSCWKFREARMLMDAGGAFAISDTEALLIQFRQMESHPELYKKATVSAASFVEENQGATRIIMNWISENFRR